MVLREMQLKQAQIKPLKVDFDNKTVKGVIGYWSSLSQYGITGLKVIL